MIRVPGWLGVLAASGLLAACSSAQGIDLEKSSTTSPSSSPKAVSTPTLTSPSPSASSTVSPEAQAVLDAYAAFYVAMDKARKDPVHAREILTPVAADPQLTQTATKLVSLNDAGIEAYGQTILKKPIVASLTRDQAVVHDCQDTANVGNRKRANGDPIVHGRPNDSATTTLIRAGTVWKVTSTTFPKDPETYCG